MENKDNESVDDLISSIRRLTYPGELVELLHPVKDDSSESPSLLSSKTIEEAERSMGSFLQAVEEEPEKTKSGSLEDFLASLIQKPLNEMIEKNEGWIRDLIQRSLHDSLTQWLNLHLPSMVEKCVNAHLSRLSPKSK